MKPCRVIILLLTLLLAPSVAQAAELVMVEQAGCEWCEAWDKEVGGVYARTPEGRIAPLRRVDIHDPLPRDLRFIRGLAFTPTFVLVDEGREIGRITGYPGEAFFWGRLDELLRSLPATPGTARHTITQTRLDGPAQNRNEFETRGQDGQSGCTSGC